MGTEGITQRISTIKIGDKYYGITDTLAHTRISNQLSFKNPQYENIDIDENVTSIDQILNSSINNGQNDAVIYRVAKWDGIQYNEGTYSEYGWDKVFNKYILLSVKTIQNTNGDIQHLTQAQYDELDDVAKNSGIYYFIEEEEV